MSARKRPSLYSADDWKREVDEGGSSDPWRLPVGRDYGRIIHSASFRRLQGKTQVFPGHESDFFRNRLTHSLEVAQIASGIAERLNHVDPYFRDFPLDLRLCEAAALLHDIGHPPFGHNGERALDDLMRGAGGFEGNAQTLRIISRLEKKVLRAEDSKGDGRAGLNLTYRLMAAVLKYDRVIPARRTQGSKLVKGYYQSEADVVRNIKQHTTGGRPRGKFKTIECSIMDVADDIAYSTYDLEDSLKAGFLSPASILASKDGLLVKVAKKTSEELSRKVSADDVLDIFSDIFADMVPASSISDVPFLVPFVQTFRASQALSDSGYLRTKLSSELVHKALNSVEVEPDPQYPMLSKAYLNHEARLRVEVLKQYTFESTIYSSRVKLPEFRGYEVVKSIFKALASKRGYLMMPDDVRENHADASSRPEQLRIICDFVAGMTDRYATEFFDRLHSNAGHSMFKPV
ncbi:dGTP triphosphohydrolase [Bradyrhizobium tunisiense]|uniref:dGTP triphosphohydrolase n=1 Tax=Bradyrhizobium tunisiense TaxID=3278709 RepID=UPI0035D601DC